MNGWYKQVTILLKPLYEALKKEVFKSGYCQADETTTPVVDNHSCSGQGKAQGLEGISLDGQGGNGAAGPLPL